MCSSTGVLPSPARSLPCTAEPIFTARGVRKVYEMGEVTVEALRGVDFDLFEGEFVVLLGPSGSGKSTLLNILGGLDVPTSGEVRYRDHNLTAAGEAALTVYRRDHVGFVFQFYNLIPSLTALENVALVTEIVDHPTSTRCCGRAPPTTTRRGSPTCSRRSRARPCGSPIVWATFRASPRSTPGSWRT